MPHDMAAPPARVEPLALARRERTVGERLPYARHLDDSTLQTRDGLTLQVLHLRGFPFETAESGELDYRRAVRATLLQGLANPRFAIYHHVVRRPVAAELEGRYEDAFCMSLDAAWRAQLAARTLYANDLFLTIVQRPVPGRAGWLQGLVGGLGRAADSRAAEATAARDLRELDAACEAMAASLEPYGARRLTMYETPAGLCSELLEFLSCLLNGEMRPVLVPEGDLGRHIPYRRVSFGADTLELSGAGRLRRTFAAMVSVKAYPAHTAAGLLDDLLRLPFEMTVSESFAFVGRQATLDKMNLVLRRLRAADDEALSFRTELTAAKDEVAAGRAAFGEHHLTVMVKAASLSALDNAVAAVLSAFTDIGAVAVREDINLEAAFWAQFPGNFSHIARRALISTANYAGLASCHGFPLGQADGNHWGPAVTVLETTSAGPYYFNFHRGDLGNFTVIGPSGSGKTVVLTFLLAQARKFGARIVYFDKDRGAEVFVRAIDGRYDVLRPGASTGFNPLALEDTPANRQFLIDWVGKLLTAQGQGLDAEELATVTAAVDANFEQDPALRRLRYFVELLGGDRRPHPADLAARLSPWIGDGQRAWLFDNAEDRLDLDRTAIGFDMTQVLDDPAVRTPAMMYLFHRVEQRLDGTPAIIVVDEGWKALDDEIFVLRIKDWEKTIRKRNGIVGFCTQSASDALSSRISSAIVEQAATQIFMANPKAREEEYRAGFGLTEHELELVRSVPDTSRCFLVKHGLDSVLARLDLSGMPDVLRVLSGREENVRRLDAIRARVGEEPAAWLPPFLEDA